MKTELTFGLHAVTALIHQHPDQILDGWADASRDDEKLRALLAELAALGVHVQRVTGAQLDKLCQQGRHQGVVLRHRPTTSALELADVLAKCADSAEAALLLVLDGVQDPHNLGACLRNADGAGAHAVVIPQDRAATLTPTVRKVACGAAESVPLVVVPNLARALRQLQEAGIWVIGTAGETEKSLYAVDLRRPVALVLGAEEKGMRRLTREHCDEMARIPLFGTVESLNVSAASAVALFEARRQRLRTRR